MVNRREFLGTTISASAALALTSNPLSALQESGGILIQRAVPSSGENLPIISFGARPAEPAAVKEVLKTFVDQGGKVVDVLHGGPAGEQGARAAADELGIQDKFFWTTPLIVSIPVLPGYAGPPLKPAAAAVRAAMEEKFATFKVPKIDLVMVSAAADVPLHLAVLREMKKEGRVRYIGVHELLFPPNSPTPPTARLEAIMRNESLDFIGVDYSVGDRRIEEKILPLAAERKIGAMAYFPFDRNRLFKRASATTLPQWAADFGAKTWAQFFLKYVVSHPAVTMARVGTTKAAHILDNIGGGIGRLPDEATRKRMADFVDALPPTPPAGPAPQPKAPEEPPIVISAEVMDRYVGEYHYAAAGQTVTFRRDGDRLLMKIVGNVPEVPLLARSETRFLAPWELIIEFQVDGEKKVNAAVVRQGANRIQLVRQ
jgi:aryl-alcohol dehydrogenase-like predicted oxidoreductase